MIMGHSAASLGILAAPYIEAVLSDLSIGVVANRTSPAVQLGTQIGLMKNAQNTGIGKSSHAPSLLAFNVGIVRGWFVGLTNLPVIDQIVVVTEDTITRGSYFRIDNG